MATGLLLPLPAVAEPLKTTSPPPGQKSPSGQPIEAPKAQSTARAENEAARARQRGQSEAVADVRKHLEFLAILWTEVARTLADAQKDEAEADRLEQQVVDLDDKAKRTLLLLEQTEARRARALSRLNELEAGAKP
jgi:hypothetical protein